MQAVTRYKQIFPDASVRYIVFGKANADEGKLEFGTNAIVSTLHSYAYTHVVKQYELGAVRAFLTWRDIPKSIRMPFGKSSDILTIIEDYCKSDHLTLDSYVNNRLVHEPDFDRRLVPFTKQLLNQMAKGNMPITHSFYLKLFHIFVMTERIQLPHVERLLVDEFQDMSGLALDIINATPADQKVFVGDSNQSIFHFLKLQDGFSKFPEAKVLTLSKSFRVDKRYAPAIQEFLRNHLEPEAVFEGMDYPADVKPVTKAYLTRTNAKLIAKMIELNKTSTPYHLSHKTKLKDMFKFPLALIYAKPAFDQKDHELKHLQQDIDDWGSLSTAKRQEICLTSYLKEANVNDAKIISAINLVLNFERQDILDAYEHANDHRNKPCDLQLMTAHTSKGATRDIIELDNDLNDAVKDIITLPMDKLTEEQRSELCLYFVSITRHRFKLIGAKHLNLLEE